MYEYFIHINSQTILTLECTFQTCRRSESFDILVIIILVHPFVDIWCNLFLLLIKFAQPIQTSANPPTKTQTDQNLSQDMETPSSKFDFWFLFTTNWFQKWAKYYAQFKKKMFLKFDLKLLCFELIELNSKFMLWKPDFWLLFYFIHPSCSEY